MKPLGSAIVATAYLALVSLLTGHTLNRLAPAYSSMPNYLTDAGPPSRQGKGSITFLLAKT